MPERELFPIQIGVEYSTRQRCRGLKRCDSSRPRPLQSHRRLASYRREFLWPRRLLFVPARTIRGGGLTTCRGRKSCLHSGSRPKWPAWRNRRRVPVRPIQAKAKLWSIALVDRGWSGRFRPQGRLPVYFEASRPASATRIGRDRVPDSGWNHFGLSPGPGLLLSVVEYPSAFSRSSSASLAFSISRP